MIRVLQTHALPLGYVAILLNYASLQVTPTGIEPVLPPWKGDVLTAWPRSLIFKKTPRVGLEPTTSRLTAVRSTIELSRNISFASFRMSFVHSKLHTKSKNQTFLKAGHLDSASLHLDDFAFIFVKWSLQMLRIFSVICRQMYVRLKNQLRKQASSAASSSVLPFYSLFGQALDRLVTVSSMCCHTSTSALSTL